MFDELRLHGHGSAHHHPRGRKGCLVELATAVSVYLGKKLLILLLPRISVLSARNTTASGSSERACGRTSFHSPFLCPSSRRARPSSSSSLICNLLVLLRQSNSTTLHRSIQGSSSLTCTEPDLSTSNAPNTARRRASRRRWVSGLTYPGCMLMKEEHTLTFCGV